ncbi:MAG: hypothetical protein JSV79_07475 [Armatimonadota bacterium]|nr:MAG: hypothetical protein JSV79_07475 [Armatimonadota bacterium]
MGYGRLVMAQQRLRVLEAKERELLVAGELAAARDTEVEVLTAQVRAERARGLRAELEEARAALSEAEEAAGRVAAEQEVALVGRESDRRLRDYLRGWVNRLKGEPKQRAYRVHRNKAGDWVRDARQKPVGWITESQLGEMAAELQVEPAALLARLKDLVRRGQAKTEAFQIVFGQRARIKNWAELEEGMTATEMRAALKVLREEAGLTREGAPRYATRWARMKPEERAESLRGGGYGPAQIPRGGEEWHYPTDPTKRVRAKPGRPDSGVEGPATEVEALGFQVETACEGHLDQIKPNRILESGITVKRLPGDREHDILDGLLRQGWREVHPADPDLPEHIARRVFLPIYEEGGTGRLFARLMADMPKAESDGLRFFVQNEKLYSEMRIRGFRDIDIQGFWDSARDIGWRNALRDIDRAAQRDVSGLAWKDLPPEAQAAFRKATKAPRAKPPEPAEYATYRQAYAEAREAEQRLARAEGLAAPPTPAAQVAEELALVRRAKNEALTEIDLYKWARSRQTRRRWFPQQADAAAEEAKLEAMGDIWADALERGWDPEALQGLSKLRDFVAEKENYLGYTLADLGIISLKTAERWKDIHLRRVVPFFRRQNIREMRAWLEAHGPEHIGELVSRALRGGRFAERARYRVRIPEAIRRPRKMPTAEPPEYLGTELVAFEDRFAEGQRLGMLAQIRMEGLRDLAQKLSVDPLEYAALPKWQQARFRLIPESKALGPLGGRYVDEAVEKILYDWERIPGVMERIVSIFKLFKVPMSTATVAHNIVTNKVALCLEFGIEPVLPHNLLAAARELAGEGSGLWAMHRNAYPLGAGIWANAEVRAGLTRMARGKTGAGLYNTINDLVLENAARGYGAVELLDKWSAARLEILRGVPAAAAMRRADRTLLNYGRMPQFIKTMRRHPLGIPFCSYVWGMGTDVIPHWMKRHPGKMWAIYKAPHLITEASGEHDRIELERACMPAHLEPALMMRVGTDWDGAGLWVPLSRALPFSEYLEGTVLAAKEGWEDIQKGGMGVGLETPLRIVSGMGSPAYTLFADLNAIAAGDRPLMYGYAQLEDPSLGGKIIAMGARVGRDIAPGILVDAIRVAKADGPTMERPWQRDKRLEAIRAAGIPIVRVRPDLEYFRALEQAGNTIHMATGRALTAKTKQQKWFWERVGNRAQKRLDLLMRLGPPPGGAELPFEAVRDVEEMLIFRESPEAAE